MRWKATIYYRTATGTVDITHDFDEIADLHDLVERGPHWDTIERIVILRADPAQPYLTVEEAARQ
jgi:hypothetical protein